MSDWWLADGVHAVAHGDDLVFLHVRADAYYCLPEAAAAVAIGEARRLHIAEPALARELQAAGLVVASAHAAGGPARPVPPRPSRTALRAAYPPPRPDDLGPALRSLTDLFVAYRRRPFHELVAAAASARNRPAQAPGRELLGLVDRFNAWVPYAPVSGKCLLRSFMLLRLLRRAGHEADWVFGVATWPFQAHCWLQCGDVALDDFPDRLTPYRPILVV